MSDDPEPETERPSSSGTIIFRPHRPPTIIYPPRRPVDQSSERAAAKRKRDLDDSDESLSMAGAHDSMAPALPKSAIALVALCGAGTWRWPLTSLRFTSGSRNWALTATM